MDNDALEDKKLELIREREELLSTQVMLDEQRLELDATLEEKKQENKRLMDDMANAQLDIVIEFGRAIRRTDKLLGNYKRNLKGRDLDSLRDTLADLQVQYFDSQKWDVSKILELDKLDTPALNDGSRHGASEGRNRGSTWLLH